MACVSLIIPVYNTEDYIEQCLDSVIGQTLTDIEILCVLDGPTDQSGLIAKQYAEKDPRIIIIEQSNAGISSARNTGLKSATSEYILFIDSDDWVSPEFAQRLYESAQATDAGMVICNFQYYRESLIPEKSIPGGIHDPKEICRELLLDNVIKNYAWNKLFKKEIFIEHGIFFPEGLLYEDLAIMSQVAYHSKKVVIIDEYLYFYRSRPNSIMSTFDKKRFLDLFKVMESVRKFLKDENISQLYQVEFQYSCAQKLVGAAWTICRKSPHLIYLIDEIVDMYKDLLDGRKHILPRTKELMSRHNRLSLSLLNFDQGFYKFLAVRKWI